MKRMMVLALMVLLVCSSGVLASDWPSRNPVVTVGFSAGGGTDTAVRPVLAKMSEYLGTTINVVNMPGASGGIAAAEVLQRKPDGYNLYATGSGPFVGLRVFDYVDTDWTDWVSWHPFSGPAGLIARPGAYKSLDDAMEALRSGKCNVGISGFGAGPHVLAEVLFGVAGVSGVNYVTFDSCHSAAVGVIAGEVEFAMISFSAGVDFAEANQVEAVVLTSFKPYTLANGKEIPAIVDVLAGSEHVPLLSETWPIFIRRDTPQPIIDKLTEAFIWAMEQPEIAEFAASRSLNIAGYYGEEADRFLSMHEAGYAWAIHNAGLGQVSPEKLGIPTIDEWNWEIEKQKMKK